MDQSQLAKVVFLKTVAAKALVRDVDPYHFQLSLDGGQTWSSIRKDFVVSVVPINGKGDEQI